MSDDRSSPSGAGFNRLTLLLLDNIKRAAYTPIYKMPLAQARLAYKSAVGVSELPRVPVARTEDFLIPGPAGDIQARLWADSAEPGLPVLLYLHGGGFVIGDVDTCESMCRQLAVQSGVAVVAINYRLAPEHKYPAGLEDAWAAFNWLLSQGHTVGVNGRRMAVAGDSAGGTLAACVALMARDGGLPLALQALIYPSVQTRSVTDSFKRYSQDTLLSAELMMWFEAQARGGRLDHAWYREPLHAPRHDGLAPAWIGLAECDALTDEGLQYADTLKAAGVPVEVRVWPGVIHDFINMGRFLSEAAELHGELAHVVRRALLS
jgi:acetyl esterase